MAKTTKKAKKTTKKTTKKNTKKNDHLALRAVAALLVLGIFTVVILFCFGVFNKYFNQTYLLEAEEGSLAGGATVVEDEALEYVDFSDSGTVTFTIVSDKDANAELTLCITQPADDTDLAKLIGITVNGEPFETEDVIVKGDEDHAWREVKAGEIALREGENTIVFTGTGNIDFDYFKLTVKKTVKLELQTAADEELDDGKIPKEFRGTWVGDVNQINGSKHYTIEIGKDDISVRRDSTDLELSSFNPEGNKLTFEDKDNTPYTLTLDEDGETMTFECFFYSANGTLTKEK